MMKSVSKVWEVVRICDAGWHRDRLAHLKYNMLLTTLKRCSCWKACVLSPQLSLLFHHAHSLEKVLSFLHPQSLTLQPLMEDRCLWCPIAEVIDVTCTPPSPQLGRICLLLSLTLYLALSYSWANIFFCPLPRTVMFMLIFKCVSPSVLTPARCQGQAKNNNTGIGSYR